MNTVLITYLVVANERPLDAIQPTEALVWKKVLELTDIDVSVKPDPDWCYDHIIQANPDFANYTIAIWGVDIETV